MSSQGLNQPMSSRATCRDAAMRRGASASASVSSDWLAFCAPFHLSKPYWDGRALLVQVVNSTAGILSGDRLATEVVVGEGASLIVTAPSASRIFTMNEGAAQATQRFTVERCGWLEVAPE